MNKKRKNISVKNSFWKTYGRIIIEITKIVIESIVELLWIPFLIGTGACVAYLLTDLFNMDNLMASLIGLAVPGSFFICYLLSHSINERRLPLSKDEIQRLGLETVQDYSTYVDNILKGRIIRNNKILIRLIISIYYEYRFDRDYKIYLKEDSEGKLILKMLANQENIEKLEGVKEVSFEEMFDSSVPLKSDNVISFDNSVVLKKRYENIFYQIALEITDGCPYLQRCCKELFVRSLRRY
jgi:hypothetical protein